MSWLSEGLRRLLGSDAYERAKRQLSKAVLAWLADEARPWLADLLVKNGLARDRAEALAAEIADYVAARIAAS
jgi:hypothetical protein